MSSPKVISAGSVTASVSLAYSNVLINQDGSTILYVTIMLNNCLRQRQLKVSADGMSFWLDGNAIANPPAALLALGQTLSSIQPNMNSLLAIPAIVSALVVS